MKRVSGCAGACADEMLAAAKADFEDKAPPPCGRGQGWTARRFLVR